MLDNIPKETLPNLLSKVNYQDEDTSPIHWAVKKQCHNDLVILMRGKGGKVIGKKEYLNIESEMLIRGH